MTIDEPPDRIPQALDDSQSPRRPEPMSVGTVLEVGIGVTVRRWRTMLGLALLFAGPAALFTAAAGTHLNGVAEDIFDRFDPLLAGSLPVLTAAEVERLTAALGVLAVATLLAGVLGSIGAVAISAAVLGPRDAWGAELVAATRIALRRTPSVVAFMLVTSTVMAGLVLMAVVTITLATSTLTPGSIAQGGPGAFVALIIAVALVVALAYLTMRWAGAYPAMAVEGMGWRAALGRSWTLTADHVLRVACIVVFAALLTLVGTTALAQLILAPLGAILGDASGLDPALLQALVVAAATVLLAPFPPALLAVLYADLRARRPEPPGLARAGGPQAR